MLVKNGIESIFLGLIKSVSSILHSFLRFDM